MKQIKLYEMYYSLLDDPTFLDLLIYYTYRLNDTKLFKNKLLGLIYKLEFKKFGKHEEKIIEDIPITSTILSRNNVLNNITNFYRTKAFEIYHIELENGFYLNGADKHLVMASKNYEEKWVYLEDLTSNHYVLTTIGWSKVVSVVNTHKMQYMYDMSIAENDHSFFSNGILSHNTTTVSAYFIWFLCFHNDKTAMVVANKGRTGKEIIKKIKEMLEELPFFIKPGIVKLSEAAMQFENGCSLSTAAASKSPATGDSLNLLYIDEVALIPANIIDEYWASVYPTLSSFRGSQIILTSTPRGKGNLFYKFYNGAITHTIDGWKYNRTDWWEVPDHDEKWLEEQRQDLGENLFKREIELSFDVSASRVVSDYSMLLMNKIKQQFISHEFFNIPLEISRKIIWHPNFDPEKLSYYDLKNRRFLLVVDTAQGIEAGAAGKKDSDYNIVNIFEIEGLSPNRIEKNRNNKPITTKDVIQYKQIGIYMDNLKDEEQCAIASKYIVFDIFKCGFKDIDNVRVLVEMNFNGNNWLNKFKTHPNYYEPIIIKTQHGVNQTPGQRPKMMLGFRTVGGKKGKAYYCDLGAAMMHKRQILISQYDDDDINHSSIGELSQFTKSDKGNGYEGTCCHDDISVTCLFVSIASESSSFIQWINEWLETCMQTYKINRIRQMLEMYVETETQMSDEMMKAFYSAASAGFGKLTYQQNGYGNLMQGNIQQNRFNERQVIRYNNYVKC